MPAEPAADDPRPGGSRSAQPRNGILDGRRRDLIAVAQAFMRGVEQLPERDQVVALEGRAGLLHTLVLVEDVQRAAIKRVGQPRDRLDGRVAQTGDAQLLTCANALRSSLVIARRGVAVMLAGVERHELPIPKLELDRHHLQRAKVDPQGAVALAEQRGELVEQAGLRPDPLVLDPRAKLRELDPIGLVRAGDRDQRERQGDLERGR